MKLERTLVMGILNVTPDSFADGGRHFDFEAAINRAKEKILKDKIIEKNAIEESTKFRDYTTNTVKPYIEKETILPPHLEPLAAECAPFYAELIDKSLKVS